MLIKNCIVQVGLRSTPPELRFIELEFEKIPAEHQIKFLKENSESKKFTLTDKQELVNINQLKYVNPKTQISNHRK